MVGMINASLNAEYPLLSKTARVRNQHLGFSIAWSGGAALLWPITLPCTYFSTGFAQDGFKFTSAPD